MPHNSYRPDLMGTATITPLGEFEVRSWQSFTLTYTAGTFGIDDQGGIKIGMRGHFDGSRFQTADSKMPGYVTAEASNGAPLDVLIESRRNIRPWNKSIFIRCLRFLNEGDTVTLRLGDTRKGSPGLKLQTFCESKLTFQVLVDAFATYDFIPLPDAVTPKISLVPGAPVAWKLVAPSLRRPGEPFRLSIKAEDVWGNPSNKIDQTIFLTSTAAISGLPKSVVFRPGDFGQVIDGLTVTDECVVQFAAQDQDGDCLAQSNKMVIRNSPFAHYWSDMHGQSGETIGINTAREYFEFARDRSFLDICGHQGNDFQISDAFWEELNTLTAEFNENGRFLAVPGYEWSGNTGTGGDHNVWYRTEGRPIYRSSRALVSDQRSPETDVHRLPGLFDRLKDEDAIVVAHVGGRYADVKYAFDAHLEPSVEIHSAWGTFEWILKDAFDMGYRVGIVASSDGHKGRPGASYPGDSSFGSYGGLTCHLLPALDRDCLFSEFRRRHHYATTGARIYLDVAGSFANGCLITDPGAAEPTPAPACTMGDVVSARDKSMSLSVSVEGTAPIERIDIFDAAECVLTHRPWDPSELGQHVRLTLAGQHYRGRGRLVRWEGTVKLTQGKIIRFATANFWNPDKTPEAIKDNEIAWQVVTTGGEAAIDLWVDDLAVSGDVIITTNIENASFPVSEIDAEGRTINCSGMDIRFNVKRLPDTLEASSFKGTFELEIPAAHEAKYYVRVSQTDGHKAWSSPLYVTAPTE